MAKFLMIFGGVVIGGIAGVFIAYTLTNGDSDALGVGILVGAGIGGGFAAYLAGRSVTF